jgi:hypothetical protein
MPVLVADPETNVAELHKSWNALTPPFLFLTTQGKATAVSAGLLPAPLLAANELMLTGGARANCAASDPANRCGAASVTTQPPPERWCAIR